MQKKILQFLPYSYYIHIWWLEKIAQTLGDWFNAASNITCINIASDLCRWYTGQVRDKKDTIYVPSFDIVYNYPIPKIWTKRFWDIMKQIREYRPNIIMTHTRFFVQSMIGGLVAKRIWCKRVHVEHGSWFVTWYPWHIRTIAWIFDRSVGRWIFRSCDTIVTISQMHKTFIKKFTSKEPIVIYNPIDYVPQLRVKNNVPHIGFVWSLISRKGVDLLIQALKQLEDKAWICTIVGEGNQREKLDQLVQQLWLADRINFVWADDRANRLHTFDIFVNPSYQEWLPTTVVEALLAKCIVVATDVWWTKEIADGKDLMLCTPADISSLQININNAINMIDTQWLSHKSVAEKFSKKKAINSYLNVYKSL